MLKTNMKSIFAISLITLSSLTPVFALAKQPGEVIEKLEQKMLERETKSAERELTRETKKLNLETKKCELTNKRIDNKISMYTKTKKFHQDKFQSLHDKIAGLLTKFEDKGLDVTDAEADLAIFQAKIAVLNTDFSALQAALATLKTTDCTGVDGTGSYAHIYDSVKDALTLVQTDVKDIRDFLRETMRPDIVALRKLLADDLSEDSDESSESSESTESDE